MSVWWHLCVVCMCVHLYGVCICVCMHLYGICECVCIYIMVCVYVCVVQIGVTGQLWVSVLTLSQMGLFVVLLLCCTALRCAVLCCAGLGCAVLGWAVLGCARLCWTVIAGSGTALT